MLKFIIKILFYLCGFVCIIMFTPGSILLDIHPRAYFYPLPKSFEGALDENEVLSRSKKIFENQIVGPESLAIYNGTIVTGDANGIVYQLVNNKELNPLFKLLGRNCNTDPWNRTACGRALGMKFNSKGVLYIVDPDFGVYAVTNPFSDQREIKLVFDIKETSVLEKQSKFFDDVVVDTGGGLNGGDVLYVSDVSSKFTSAEFIFIIGGSDTGRILKYDVNAKKVEVIAEDLLFPNGLEISDDKSAILFSESIARQIHKHYIRGTKKGQTEIFIAMLPGEPDNIRRSALSQETYWVGITLARDSTKPQEIDYYLRRPLLRKLICRTLHLFGNVIEYLGNAFNYEELEELGYNMKTGEIATSTLFDEPYGLVIELNKDGKIITSLHSPDGSVAMISEVREVRVSEKATSLYCGSYINNYIALLELNR